MNLLLVAIDVAIGFVGVCIGEVDAIRRFAKGREVMHQHIWGPWELTDQKIKVFKSEQFGFVMLSVQQHACLDCNKIEQQMIDFT